MQFASDFKDPPASARVVYVDGSFDIFHPGHLAFLKKAKELGDFLIVGLHEDSTVASVKGLKYPIMNLLERAQCILSCRYVDEVVIGAPFAVSQELLDHFNVSVVAHGVATPILMDPKTGQHPYAEPLRRSIFVEIDSGSELTTEGVVARVLSKRALYEERNKKKEQKELEIIKKQQHQVGSVVAEIQPED